MIPEELLYTKTHEWVRLDNDKAVVGVTHFAQEQLGDLTFIELPQPGVVVQAGKEMGSIESVKAASELYSPVDGVVSAVNAELENNPGLVNEDPYGKGWMIEVALSARPAGLLDAAGYRAIADAGH